MVPFGLRENSIIEDKAGKDGFLFKKGPFEVDGGAQPSLFEPRFLRWVKWCHE